LAELAHLLAPLNAALFTLGSDHVSVAELLGFVTGAASVWLTVLARTVARSGWPLLACCVVFAALTTWGLTVLLEVAHDIALFLAMCLAGLRGWRRVLRSGDTARALPERAAVAGGSAA
jgi:hypothetical protein